MKSGENMIQYLAMLTMAIDHIGVAFFPEQAFFRVIGRLAFPLYAFGIVQGYKHTRSRKKYHNRLLLLALVSQIPFMMALNVKYLNVIFTFMICFCVLWSLEHLKRWQSGLVILVALVILSQGFDYGVYGLLLVMIYHYGKNMILLHLLLNLVFFLVYGWVLQLFSVISTIIIQKRHWFRSIQVNKFLYRSFYPSHLAIIAILKFF